MTIKTIIRHRVNTKSDLSLLDVNLGVELDLRTHDNSIVLNHEPFENGELLKHFLNGYGHSTCILNTKEDGLEERIIELLEEFSIKDYFFLDTTLPTTIKYVNKSFKKIAIRFSEYEPLEFVKNFEGLVEWVWVDCFTKNMLSKDAYVYLKKHFKICIVSPELQGHPFWWIEDFKKNFLGFTLDAVCTKRPELWK
jgi:hypothetical protein